MASVREYNKASDNLLGHSVYFTELQYINLLTWCEFSVIQFSKVILIKCNNDTMNKKTHRASISLNHQILLRSLLKNVAS